MIQRLLNRLLGRGLSRRSKELIECYTEEPLSARMRRLIGAYTEPGEGDVEALRSFGPGGDTNRPALLAGRELEARRDLPPKVLS